MHNLSLLKKIGFADIREFNYKSFLNNDNHSFDFKRNFQKDLHFKFFISIKKMMGFLKWLKNSEMAIKEKM